MEQETLTIFSHPDFADRAHVFQEQYNLKKCISTGDVKYSKRNLKRHSERTCRFCGYSYPAVKFSNYSHLVPQLIGNKNMYSDFECDVCNAQFSSLENDLANFIGVSRSISGMKEDGAPPGFAGRKLKAKSRSFIGNDILIIAPEDVERSTETIGKSVMKYTKNGFIPSNVYKAIVKSGLSLFSDQEINQDYDSTLAYLKGKINLETGSLITGYKLSFQMNLPLHMFIFEKKRPNDKIPTHVISFYFQNHIITLPLLLHKHDIPLYNDSFSILAPPPYFTNEAAIEASQPMSYRRDLSSQTMINDEEESLTIEIQRESLNNTSVYDPATGTITAKAYNPSGIKYFILTRDGVSFNPEELSEFIKKHLGGQ